MPEGEDTTYVGNVDTVNMRDDHQKLTTNQSFAAGFSWAAFHKTSFFKALGLEGFGVAAVQNLAAFGAAFVGQKTTGRLIRFDVGHSVGAAIFTDQSPGNHVGRMDRINPELIEGGTPYYYAWHDLTLSRYIPELDLQDNESATQINLKAKAISEMEQTHVQDLSNCIIGSTSAPDAGILGASSVYSDLPNLISVNQTRTVGAISATNAFWQNGRKAITDIGGGGESDRPLLLRRSMINQAHDQAIYSESSSEYLNLATQGFYEYYGDLAYSDSVHHGMAVVNSAYDTARIKHHIFDGDPMIWDPAVVIPWGANAGTEAMYGIDKANFFISFHKAMSFEFHGGWEGPRIHDQLRFSQALVETRYTPMVTGRRTHYVLYELPANPS